MADFMLTTGWSGIRPDAPTKGKKSTDPDTTGQAMWPFPGGLPDLSLKPHGLFAITPRMEKARGTRAILRRLLLVAGLLTGLAMALWPRPVVYRLRATDFRQDQQKRRSWDQSRNLTLPDYIKKTTEGRLLVVKGQAWEELLKRCLRGQNRILLPPARMPWGEELAARAGNFTYVHVEDAKGLSYLDVTAIRPGDYTRVPAKLRYPLRTMGLWILLAAGLAYLLVPWPGAGSGTLSYRRGRGVMLPDILGTVFLALFYALPWLIIPSTTGHSSPIAPEGMLPLTVILWAFALLGIVFFWIAARTEAWSLRVGEETLRLTTITGVETIPFDRIERIEETPVEAPAALAKWGWLMSLLSWRAAGPTLLMTARSDSQIQIVLTDGSSRRFVRTCLRNVNVLVEACRDAGWEDSAAPLRQ